MSADPLVSIICICYNQAAFVHEAMASVLAQSYSRIELIVIDDFSTDGSPDVIAAFLEEHQEVRFIRNEERLGNCKTFNKAFAQSSGNFLIDLAADDLLLPDRVKVGVSDFLHQGERTGVHFSNADIINESGDKTGIHHAGDAPPSGDVYLQLIEHYFINPVTMMIRRKTLEALGGYNESLDYEDFDFWIRSSREWLYYYSPQILAQKRTVKNSLSSVQVKWFNKHQRTTLEVCRTIFNLNMNESEDEALKRRIRYEIKQSLALGNVHLIPGYFNLLSQLKKRR